MQLNKVTCGDSLNLLPKLDDESIDLIYLDPPFFTNREFKISNTGREKVAYIDKWQNGLNGYLKFMNCILHQSYRILKPTGSMYLQCDSHASHYLKVKADKIFGYRNFRNEIIWRRHNSHNDFKQGCKLFGKVHDCIFLYSKTSKYTWNPFFIPYDESYLKKNYRHTEYGTGRKFALGDLSGPGGSSKGNPYYEFLGNFKYWRYNEKKMSELLRQGRISKNSKSGYIYLKRYLDEMKGVPLQDIWDDIMSINLTRKENFRYPTQKPLKLLERIISISSNPGDTILDPFCGSGTSLLAAESMGRSWIGIDSNSDARNIASHRISMHRKNMKIIDKVQNTNPSNKMVNPEMDKRIIVPVRVK